MIQILKTTLLILGSVILQIALVSRIPLLGSSPDLPLALVVSMALFRGSLYGELVGFTSGLFCDLFSDGPILGVQAFSKVLVGYGIGFVRGRLYSDNFITQSVSGFIATVADRLITQVHLSLLFADVQHIRFSGLMLAAVSNSVLVVAVFWLLKRFIKE